MLLSENLDKAEYAVYSELTTQRLGRTVVGYKEAHQQSEYVDAQACGSRGRSYSHYHFSWRFH